MFFMFAASLHFGGLTCVWVVNVQRRYGLDRRDGAGERGTPRGCIGYLRGLTPLVSLTNMHFMNIRCKLDRKAFYIFYISIYIKK